MSKKFLSPIVFLIGATVGVLAAAFDGWSIIEPVIGMATLAVAGLAWFYSIRFERKLSSMDHKKFEITFGLRAGYEGEETDFALVDARKAIRSWMSSRIERSLPILSGMTQDTVLIYPVRNGEDGQRVTEEISGQFSGSLSPKYDKGRSEAEVVETLNDLARFLGLGLEQKRIYLSFAGKQWVIDVEEKKVKQRRRKNGIQYKSWN